jgi:hypothetical protein
MVLPFYPTTLGWVSNVGGMWKAAYAPSFGTTSPVFRSSMRDAQKVIEGLTPNKVQWSLDSSKYEPERWVGICVQPMLFPI